MTTGRIELGHQVVGQGLTCERIIRSGVKLNELRSGDIEIDADGHKFIIPKESRNLVANNIRIHES